MDSNEVKLKRGFWKPEEDVILKRYVETHGEGNWATLSKKSGLMRGAKSCRLRWKNYLRPNIKHGRMSQDEEDLIIRMHKLLGNRWSLIAGRLPGRTDNEVKNYWNTHLDKKSRKRKRIPCTATNSDSNHQDYADTNNDRNQERTDNSIRTPKSCRTSNQVLLNKKMENTTKNLASRDPAWIELHRQSYLDTCYSPLMHGHINESYGGTFACDNEEEQMVSVTTTDASSIFSDAFGSQWEQTYFNDCMQLWHDLV